MVKLRPTTAQDLEFVIGLEHHPDQRPYIGQWTVEEHLEAIARSDREHWIIENESDAAPLGYLIAYDVRDCGEGMYVKRIAVVEKSLGHGRQGLRAFVEHATRDLGAESVCLLVRRANERAKRMYRALGFVEESRSYEQQQAFSEAVDACSDECEVMRVRPAIR